MDTSLRKTPKQNRQYIPKPYKDIAKSMEAQFTQLMLNKMKGSVDRAKPLDSSGEYYESMMTEERAKILSQKGEGIGIQNLILDQIYPTRFRNKLAYKGYLDQIKNKKSFSNQTIKQHNLSKPRIKIHSGEIPSRGQVQTALKAYQKEVNYE